MVLKKIVFDPINIICIQLYLIQTENMDRQTIEFINLLLVIF